MGKIIECVGRYATTPYYLEKVCYRVYSVEELCYYFCENTDLLEKDIVNVNLANWLETECGLKELSDRLYKLMTSGGSLAQFVVTVLDYVQFCSNSKLKEIEQRLVDAKSISAAQKRKHRADYFLKNNRYVLAIHEYEAMLWEEEKSESSQFYGEIYHNIGIANANLFMFEKAADYFKKAYETDGLGNHYKGYVSALRFVLSDSEFVRRVSEDAALSHEALLLEEKMQEIHSDWNTDVNKAEMDELQKKHDISDLEYYSQVDTKISDWTEEYRLMASE